MNQGELELAILEAVSQSPHPLSGRDIAKLLNANGLDWVEKSDVNSLLHSSRTLREKLQRNDDYRWSARTAAESQAQRPADAEGRLDDSAIEALVQRVLTVAPRALSVAQIARAIKELGFSVDPDDLQVLLIRSRALAAHIWRDEDRRWSIREGRDRQATPSPRLSDAELRDVLVRILENHRVPRTPRELSKLVEHLSGESASESRVRIALYHSSMRDKVKRLSGDRWEAQAKEEMKEVEAIPAPATRLPEAAHDDATVGRAILRYIEERTEPVTLLTLSGELTRALREPFGVGRVAKLLEQPEVARWVVALGEDSFVHKKRAPAKMPDVALDDANIGQAILRYLERRTEPTSLRWLSLELTKALERPFAEDRVARIMARHDVFPWVIDCGGQSYVHRTKAGAAPPPPDRRPVSRPATQSDDDEKVGEAALAYLSELGRPERLGLLSREVSQRLATDISPTRLQRVLSQPRFVKQIEHKPGLSYRDEGLRLASQSYAYRPSEPSEAPKPTDVLDDTAIGQAAIAYLRELGRPTTLRTLVEEVGRRLGAELTNDELFRILQRREFLVDVDRHATPPSAKPRNVADLVYVFRNKEGPEADPKGPEPGRAEKLPRPLTDDDLLKEALEFLRSASEPHSSYSLHRGIKERVGQEIEYARLVHLFKRPEVRDQVKKLPDGSLVFKHPESTEAKASEADETRLVAATKAYLERVGQVRQPHEVARHLSQTLNQRVDVQAISRILERPEVRMLVEKLSVLERSEDRGRSLPAQELVREASEAPKPTSAKRFSDDDLARATVAYLERLNQPKRLYDLAQELSEALKQRIGIFTILQTMERDDVACKVKVSNPQAPFSNRIYRYCPQKESMSTSGPAVSVGSAPSNPLTQEGAVRHFVQRQQPIVPDPAPLPPQKPALTIKSQGPSFEFNVDFGEPMSLRRTVRELEARARGFREVRAGVDGAEVVARFLDWTAGGQALSRQELRYLPWSLSEGTPPLFTRDELSHALSLVGQRLKPSSLHGVIYSYLHLHPQTSLAGATRLRDWIAQQLAVYQGRNRGVHHWKERSELFGDRASEQLATLLASGESIVEQLKETELPITTHLLAGGLRHLGGRIIREQPDRLEEFLQFLQRPYSQEEGGRLREQAELPLSFKKGAIDDLLSFFHGRTDLPADARLVNFFMEVLGDPRLDPRGLWNDMSEPARNVAKRWITEEDLRMFFDEISGNRDRLLFWRRYLNAGLVTFGRIILGQDDVATASTELKKQLRQGRHASFKNGPRNLSAFLLQMGRCVVVEFSRTGNACYSYPYSRLPEGYLVKKSYTVEELKMRSIGTRLIHKHGNWEAEFHHTLEKHYQISLPREHRSWY